MLGQLQKGSKLCSNSLLEIRRPTKCTMLPYRTRGTLISGNCSSVRPLGDSPKCLTWISIRRKTRLDTTHNESNAAARHFVNSSADYMPRSRSVSRRKYYYQPSIEVVIRRSLILTRFSQQGIAESPLAYVHRISYEDVKLHV